MTAAVASGEGVCVLSCCARQAAVYSEEVVGQGARGLGVPRPSFVLVVVGRGAVDSLVPLWGAAQGAA